jgi:hypothetical protein
MVTTPQATGTLMVVIRILDMIIVPTARIQRIIRMKEDDIDNKCIIRELYGGLRIKGPSIVQYKHLTIWQNQT